MNLVKPKNLHLRNYQIESIEKCINFLKSSESNSCYNASDPGLGKTVQSAVIINTLQLQKVLIICPASVVYTWKKELSIWSPNYSTHVLKEPNDTKSLASIHICSYNFASNYIEKFKGRTYDLLILDEAHFCLAEDTLIGTPKGKIQLKDLQVGDEVYSISNNGVDIGRIIRKIKGDENESKRRIILEDETVLEGLDWHLIRTPRGWEELGKLQVSSYVSVMSQDMGCQISKLDRTNILQSKMCENRSLPKGVVGSNEKKQSNEEFVFKTKDAKDFKKNRPQTPYSRWKWYENSKSAETFKSFMSYLLSKSKNLLRVSCIYGKKNYRVPHIIQNRCGYTFFKNWFRGRWTFPSTTKSETTRFKKRREIKNIRVASIQILKQGDIGEPRKSYYDLELDKYHNYIANGVIVHNCKSPKAKRSKRILLKLFPSCTYRLALSGTPFTRSIEDGFLLFNRMNPSNFPTHESFVSRYMFKKTVPWGNKVQYYGLRNDADLKEKIYSNFFVRYRIDEVEKEIPEAIFKEITLPFKEYGIKALEDILEAEREKIIEALHSHGRFSSEFQSLTTLRRLQAEKKIKAVHDYTRDLLEQELPVVLFGHHTEPLKTYFNLFKEYKPSFLTGATTQKDRELQVKRFQDGETDLFIGQNMAAGIGITLTRSCNAVFSELDYNPSTLEQMLGRIKRIGQKNHPIVHYFVVENSIESLILKKVIEKSIIFKQIV